MGYGDYVSLVANYADQPNGETFFNEGVPHAQVVLENIFRVSKDEVDILSTKLSSEIFGSPQVIQSVIDFLHRNSGATLSILLESEVDWNHPLLKELKAQDLLERVTISFMPEDRKTTYNFTVGDSQNIRFEPDKSRSSAMCRFGDADIGAELVGRFKSFHR